jgi:hypothetical protein
MERKTSKNRVLFLCPAGFEKTGFSISGNDFKMIFEKKFSDFWEMHLGLFSNDPFCPQINDIRFIVDVSKRQEYFDFAEKINQDNDYNVLLIHYYPKIYNKDNTEDILFMLYSINKPTAITLHDLEANPSFRKKQLITNICNAASKIIVHDFHFRSLLVNEYQIPLEKIAFIAPLQNISNHSPEEENYVFQHARLLQKLAKSERCLKLKTPLINFSRIESIAQEILLSLRKSDEPSPALIDECCLLINTITQSLRLQHEGKHLLELLKEIIIELNRKTADNGFFLLQNKKNACHMLCAYGFLLNVSDGCELSKNISNILEPTIAQLIKQVSIQENIIDAAFTIKGLYYVYQYKKDPAIKIIIQELADNLIRRYFRDSESEPGEEWTEKTNLFAHSIIPEALLCAFLVLNKEIYRVISIIKFDFLLNKIFKDDLLKPIFDSRENRIIFGNSPHDVALTIMALENFYLTFGDGLYSKKIKTAFSWFLGNNPNNFILYSDTFNTCYDKIRENNETIGQSKSSLLNYFISRFVFEATKEKNLIRDRKLAI